MRFTFWFTVSLSSILLLNSFKRSSFSGEFDVLEGSWRRIDAGYSTIEESGRQEDIVFSKNQYKRTSKLLQQRTLNLDENSNPKQFNDAVVVSSRTLNTKGIYELSRKKLRRCYFTGKGIPKTFDSNEGRYRNLETWERADLRVNEHANTDGERLCGVWRLVERTLDGKLTFDPTCEQSHMEINGNHVSVLVSTINMGTINIDTTKNPMTIDFHRECGNHKGKLFLGIFRVENDQYEELQSGFPNIPRPSSFNDNDIRFARSRFRKVK